MELDDYSLNALASLILGENDKDVTPRSLSGPNIIKLFNEEAGYRDVYSYDKGGLPGALSRKQYTLHHLKEINGTPRMTSLIMGLLKKSRYLNTKYKVSKIAQALNEILNANNYNLEKIGTKYVITGDVTRDETIELSVTFKDIQNQIINEIRKAKFTIWIAMAWFTDNVLFEELKKKWAEGINIRIIVANESANTIPFESCFETYRHNKFGAYGQNIMHDKFCVIDLETVIHGTYNWTNMAQYHKEHIEVVKNRTIAEQYADKFKEYLLTANC